MVFLQIISFLFGLVIVLAALLSSIRTLVLSRAARDPVNGMVFSVWRKIFDFRLRSVKDYLGRDQIMAYFAPLALLTLPPTWLTLILIGFTFMFWGSGIDTLRESFTMSGSSLLTLGFSKGDTLFQIILAFIEATIGLIMVALLIAYLPTMYSAFSNREKAVTLLEVRAGTPPSAAEMILRYYRNHGLNALHESWKTWENWFAELEESHTTLTALVFFRSPQPGHSWITAAGTVLDAAAISLSILDIPWDAQAALCIRSGYLALTRISKYFDIDLSDHANNPNAAISVSREEFDAVCEQFDAAGVPLKPDRDQAWQSFAGWRINYDGSLIALSKLVMAPEAQWSSDRVK